MTRRNQILDALERGPCTAPAIAEATGMPAQTASSQLSVLFYLGIVNRTRTSGRGVPPYLYSLKVTP